MAYTLTYRQAVKEFRIMSSQDEWAEVMHAWFTIADEIHFNRPNLEVPESWKFRPSPLGEVNDPDDYATWIVRNVSDSDLMRLGALADRCARCLKRAGLDY